MSFRMSFTTRAIDRPTWRALWRQLRIVNRETDMATRDMVTFGTGFLRTGAGVPDYIRRVHPSNALIKLMDGQR